MAIKYRRKSGFAMAWRRLEAAYSYLASRRVQLTKQAMQDPKGNARKAEYEVW